MRTRLALNAVAIALLLLPVVRLAGQGQAVSTSTQPTSAVTLATWVTKPGSGGFVLDLLVIWRGSPGWFMTGDSRSAGGGTPGTFHASFTYGDVDVTLELDTVSRALRIQDRHFSLGDNNVVLVDGIDRGGEFSVVRMLAIDPTIPDPPRIEPLLRRSEEVLSFLRCDVKASRGQELFDRICREIMGR